MTFSKKYMITGGGDLLTARVRVGVPSGMDEVTKNM